jgi:hypothetical protein
MILICKHIKKWATMCRENEASQRTMPIIQMVLDAGTVAWAEKVVIADWFRVRIG